ncbi:uncharacterized protein [Rutidosis leptorrhynchoides]|uniref:uncharacterized protein n=1 Tax=Rutidosis leptorrhynchoides TaxID=125765 RepID=UPI003A992A24
MSILSLNIRGLGLDDKNKSRWFKRLYFREKPCFIALQEIKCRHFSKDLIGKVFGNTDLLYAVKNSKGNSGGLLSAWDPNIFKANHIVERDTFIAVKGLWKDVGTELIFVNIYGPHNDMDKKKMWQDLSEVLEYDKAMWVLLGDFNEVRFASERKNTEFIEKRAEMFNKFIKENNLIDLPLGGRIFTRISDNGRHFSKLDRFLVSENFIHEWPNIHAMVLDKNHLDHCPIILKNGNTDFGPKPIKVFDEWINHKDAREVIKRIWSKEVTSWKPDCIFREKLKNTKFELRKWFSTSQCKLKTEIEELSKQVTDWELKAETNDLTEEQLREWALDKENLILKEKNQTEMLKQKARYKWTLEGDANSKFFHSFIRRRQQKNNMHGVYVDGQWSTNPSEIKAAAHSFFKKLYTKSDSNKFDLNRWSGFTID